MFKAQPFWSFYHLFYFIADGGLDISQNVLHIRHSTLPNIVVTEGICLTCYVLYVSQRHVSPEVWP